MDKRKNNGGSRKGSGRKKGSGLSGKIKSHIDNMLFDMMKDEEIKESFKKDYIQTTTSQGWVYIIKDLHSGEYKVGVTQRKNPKERLSQYGSHKMNIELIYIEYVDFCYELESVVHDVFIGRKTKGDWFDLLDMDVLTIIKMINKDKYKRVYG